MTPIADMLSEMFAAGAPQDIILLAVRTAEASRDATVTRHASSRSNDAIRAARYRAKRKQNQPKSQPVDVAMAVSGTVTLDRDASRDEATNPPLSVLSSFELSQENPKEESKEVVLSSQPRARAKREKTRMTDDWRPDDKGMRFAGDHGLRLYQIENEVTKFRNYWINRTDRDSIKPRWDLAWENWILNVRKAPNGQGQSVVAAADRLLEDVRALKRPPVGELELLQPGIRGGEGAVDVRLLPQGRRE